MTKFYYLGLICLLLQCSEHAYAQYNDLQQQFENICNKVRVHEISWHEWGRRMETLAEKGHEMSQCCTGIYYEGNKDYKKALYWFEKAGEQGNGEALYTLGNFYRDGLGVEVDWKKAFEYWLRGAACGEVNSMVWVGNVYQNGWGITDADVYQSFKYYKMAAELGSETGQFHVGECYQRGIGVKKDLVEAKKWFQSSAEQGDERAIEELKKME